MKCPKCNAENEPGALFCENCGEKLGEIKEENIESDIIENQQNQQNQQNGILSSVERGSLTRLILWLCIFSALTLFRVFFMAIDNSSFNGLAIGIVILVLSIVVGVISFNCIKEKTVRINFILLTTLIYYIVSASIFFRLNVILAICILLPAASIFIEWLIASNQKDIASFKNWLICTNPSEVIYKKLNKYINILLIMGVLLNLLASLFPFLF